MSRRSSSIEPRALRELLLGAAPRPGPPVDPPVSVIDRTASDEREARYQQAVAWLERGGGRSRWETLLRGVVRCTVTLGGETREAVGYGSIEVARQNALLHAIEELRGS